MVEPQVDVGEVDAAAERVVRPPLRVRAERALRRVPDRVVRREEPAAPGGALVARQLIVLHGEAVGRRAPAARSARPSPRRRAAPSSARAARAGGARSRRTRRRTPRARRRRARSALAPATPAARHEVPSGAYVLAAPGIGGIVAAVASPRAAGRSGPTTGSRRAPRRRLAVAERFEEGHTRAGRRAVLLRVAGATPAAGIAKLPGLAQGLLSRAEPRRSGAGSNRRRLPARPSPWQGSLFLGSSPRGVAASEKAEPRRA